MCNKRSEADPNGKSLVYTKLREKKKKTLKLW